MKRLILSLFLAHSMSYGLAQANSTYNILPLADTSKQLASSDNNYYIFSDEMNTISTGYLSDWRAENAYSTFKYMPTGTGSISANINFDNQVPNIKGRCEIHKPLLSAYTCPIGDERVVTIKMKYFLPTLTETGNANVGGCVGQIMAWDFHRLIQTATTKPTDVAYMYLISLYMKNGQIYFQPNHEIYDSITNTYHDFYIPVNNQIIYSGSIVNKPVEITITTKFSRTNNGYVIATAKFDGDTTTYRKEIRDIITYSSVIPNGDSATRLEWKVGCYCAGNYKSYHAQVNLDWVSSKVEKYYIPITVSTLSSDITKGTVSGSATVNKGNSVTVVATPSAGYDFVNWSDGFNVVSTDISYTFVPLVNTTLTAIFKTVTSVQSQTFENNLLISDGRKFKLQQPTKSINVFNAYGKLVFAQNNLSENSSFTIAQPGIYFVRFNFFGQTLKVQKIVVN